MVSLPPGAAAVAAGYWRAIDHAGKFWLKDPLAGERRPTTCSRARRKRPGTVARRQTKFWNHCHEMEIAILAPRCPPLCGGGHCSIHRRRSVWLERCCSAFSGHAPRSQRPAYHEVQRGDFTVTVLDRGTLDGRQRNQHSQRSRRHGPHHLHRARRHIRQERRAARGVGFLPGSGPGQPPEHQFREGPVRPGPGRGPIENPGERRGKRHPRRRAESQFAKMDLDKFDEGQKWVEEIEASNKVVQAENQLAVNKETTSGRPSWRPKAMRPSKRSMSTAWP